MLSRCWAYVGAVLTKFRAEACYEGRFVGQFDLHLHDASAPSVRAGSSLRGKLFPWTFSLGRNYSLNIFSSGEIIFPKYFPSEENSSLKYFLSGKIISLYLNVF